MNFAVDENIPIELIPWLNNKNHTVFTVAKGSSDEEVAFLAKEKESILLTQDRHFTLSIKEYKTCIFKVSQL